MFPTEFINRDHSFTTYAKFSEKLTFLTPIRTRTCAYQGVRNVGFSENFTYVLNDPITEPAAQKIPENLGNTRDFTVWVNFT